MRKYSTTLFQNSKFLIVKYYKLANNSAEKREREKKMNYDFFFFSTGQDESKLLTAQSCVSLEFIVMMFVNKCIFPSINISLFTSFAAPNHKTKSAWPCMCSSYHSSWPTRHPWMPLISHAPTTAPSYTHNNSTVMLTWVCKYRHHRPILINYITLSKLA